MVLVQGARMDSRLEAGPARRVLVLGGTGTIGRTTVAELARRGHGVLCLVRPGGSGRDLPPGVEIRAGDVTDGALLRQICGAERIDGVISCLASRTGVPADAWAVDHAAHLGAIGAAQDAGVDRFVLLSAICVQKPRLAFQFAKLAAEAALIRSGLGYSIVRPTAFFKSLSGQIDRVRQGRPYLLFGDGRLTACKPLSDGDLAAYLVSCLDRSDRLNRILPIGGPGPAITPREQGERLFELTGRAPRYRHVPPGLLDGVIAGLSGLGRMSARARAKAELARIGRYYASESMLLLDPVTGRYDAAATPSTGRETLFDYYERVVEGAARVERGAHAVF